MGTVVLLVAAFAAEMPSPIVLDNGRIRVEVEPRLFSVRFVGFPGGINFLDVRDIPEGDLESSDWVEMKGLYADLIPYEASDPAIRRGPATVLEQTADHVVMIGPQAGQAPVRIRKAVRLYPGQAKASYSVEIENAGSEAVRYTVRNSAHVPQGDTLRSDKTDDRIRPLAGTASLAPAVVNSMRWWLIPVPPTSELKGVVLGAFVPKVTQENKDGTWTRRIVTNPSKPADVPEGCTFICLLDDPSRNYVSALQGGRTVAPPGGSAKFTEVWSLEKRGL